MFQEPILDTQSFVYNFSNVDQFSANWKGSATHHECTLHQVSPYIGKLKSSMAKALVMAFSKDNSYLYDPFCGAGTVALEAWIAGRNVFATDLSPYAINLTKAKLFPPRSAQEISEQIEDASNAVSAILPTINIDRIPIWVKEFFHPETLREITAWATILRNQKKDFLLACLLGILHHQRPGFLSYPSSHTVPYLRNKKFPKNIFPELYKYRPVKERLERKVTRAFKRIPTFNFDSKRSCSLTDALEFVPPVKIDAIITSPPYMRQLDYGRDNRLRLWFLGIEDWKTLNNEVSPVENQFVDLMKKSFLQWKSILTHKGICALVLGNGHCQSYGLSIPDTLEKIAVDEIKGFTVLWRYTEEIPNTRRVRKNCSASTTETILVLQKKDEN